MSLRGTARDGAVPPTAPSVISRATLVGGFLGAGKSTLLARVLAAPLGERTAVIVNDFGEVSIDAALLGVDQDGVVALANGCLCCAVRGELIDAVQALLRRAEPPERLLIELSGVADPAAVVRTLRVVEASWPLNLDGVVVVVDAEQFPFEGAPHHALAREQLALADIVVVNKVDLASAARLATLRERLRAWAPGGRLIETVNAGAPLELVLGVGPAWNRALAGAEHAGGTRNDGAAGAASAGTASAGTVSAGTASAGTVSAGTVSAVTVSAGAATAAAATDDAHGYSTFTWHGTRPLALARLREAMLELPPEVFRVKGVVDLAGYPEHRTVLHVVGRRARVDRGAPWGDAPRGSTIVAIGLAGRLDAEALRAVLDGCQGDDPPRGAWKRALTWLRRG